ncbi:response regulator transcription factor [Flavobacterium sp. LB2P84]|uniref:Response regulator transcription factor n=1 Tax=Flavobacterium yafengii TaxID=3041253 RepID=A0AAW6TJK5_9FLAO|nr:response regulator transcription factor [Flavobacterium yafengii]MDI5949797.1 response regulator transcription factor [Flavobacterium yafengii]MDI6033007.1 response regulator transcription factor [Flavobacterium yafengii]
MEKNILIVDDHFIVRSGISLLLENELDEVQVFEASDFPEALLEFDNICFDLVILDINLPGGKKCNMIDVLRELQKDVKILIFSAHEEDIYAFRYVQAGANGYLNKLSDSDTIVKAVKAVLEAGKYISIDILEKFIRFSQGKRESSNPLEELTHRELEIAELLVKGFGNLEIANELDIKMSTVSTHKLNVFKKTHITNIIELSELFKKFTN